MPIARAPVETQWYRHRDKGFQFQVISVDKDDATVDIQHFDGDLEELELADWYTLNVEPIAPPEDWTGPMDDIERDDLGYSETDMAESNRSSHLKEWGPTEEENNGT